MLRCSCGQKVRGLSPHSRHVLNFRTRYGRLTWVRGKTRVPSLLWFCYILQAQTEPWLCTHILMSLCRNHVHTETYCRCRLLKCVLCSDHSWLNSFCHFQVLLQEAEKGDLLVVSQQIWQDRAQTHTLMLHWDDTLLNPCSTVLSPPSSTACVTPVPPLSISALVSWGCLTGGIC